MITNQNRYLLHVRLSNGQTFNKTFKDEHAMNNFIINRDFFFITADYSLYDLAIELRKAG